jgi:beta-exotoxin I transport system permease protein
MAAELFRRGIVDHRRALAAWCVGIVGYVALIASIFPSIEGSPQLNDLIESYPDVLKSLFGITGTGNIASGAGFLDAELNSFMLPLLILVLAISSGARTLAGEEDAGRLELVLAYPVRWRSAVLAKGLAVAVEVLLACAAATAAILSFDVIVGLDLSLAHVAGAFASLVALGVFYGWLSLAVGAAYPRRALALGIAAGAAAVGYLVGGLHDLAGWLDPFRFLSPFWLVGQSPLQGGTDAVGVVVVVVASVVVLALGAALVERRDLEVP